MVVLLGIANFWGLSSPNGFLKCASIEVVDVLPTIHASPGGRFLDVRGLLAKIPYERAVPISNATVIHPDRRVEIVMETGSGDCSTKSRALARILQSEGIPYLVVFIMHSASARAGVGHTVVECPLELDGVKGIGLVDMLSASVPKVEGRFLSTGDLLRHQPLDVRMETANPACPVEDEYYGDFLSDAAIGISTSEDVNRYFDLKVSMYVPLGSAFAEKLVYAAGALVLASYPPVYMLDGEAERFDAWFRVEMLLARAIVWGFRMLLALSAVDLVAWLASRRPRDRAAPPQPDPQA